MRGNVMKIELDRTAMILHELAERWQDLTAREAEQMATVLQEYADDCRDREGKHREPR